MTHGSLFSGVGGFDLGFRWAGIETVWQVEIDPYCRKVLARHFPEAERFNDVRECGSHNLKRVDIITGGFPCQDISSINNQNEIGRRGIEDGSRSGLWKYFVSLVRQLRPRFVLIENVAALLTPDDRGIIPAAVVLGDLASIGYDAQWKVFRACSFGASHPRARVFILAYPNSFRLEAGFLNPLVQQQAFGEGHNGFPVPGLSQTIFPKRSTEEALASEPSILGVDYALPGRVDRLRGLGNAVVPQIAQWLAERILEAEARIGGVA